MKSIMPRNIGRSLKHVFISYSHENLVECAQVIERLRQAEIPVWHDDSIEAGENWKLQIDDALEDAFAVVVVVTPESMQSLYVTYEWSWAIGSNVPVFPLLLSGSYDNVHKRLLDEQCADCREKIPDTVIRAIHDKQKTPRDTEYLNKLISALIEPLRVYIRIVVWFYSQWESSYFELEILNSLLKHLADYTQQIARKDLPNLLIDKSNAFTRKQKQRCRLILDTTWEMDVRLNFVLMTIKNRGEENNRDAYNELLEWLDRYYTEKWLPAADALDEKYTIVDALDRYLGYKVDSPQEKEELFKRLVEMTQGKFTEDELRLIESEPKFLEDRRIFVHAVLRMAYKEEEFADIVWDIIEAIKNEI